MNWLFLLVGAWRIWLGGGILKDWPLKNGVEWLQYVLILTLALFASDSWRHGVTNGIGLLVLARIYGHGPWFHIPLKLDPDGDFIMDILMKFLPKDGEIGWWIYGVIRYELVAVAWSTMLFFQHSEGWYGPLVGVTTMLLFARLFIKYQSRLPTFHDKGSEAQNWNELVGWSAIGLALTLTQ